MLDKVVIITGASSGIGAALAVEVARRGGRGVLGARRAEALQQVCSTAGGEWIAETADVTRREDHQRLVESARKRFGRIDVWVNNAGQGISRVPSALTDEDIDEMFLINAKSAIFGVQAVLPHMRSRGSGQIINVSSMLAKVPYFAPRAAYSAAKAYLNSWTASLRLELRGTGIHVTLLLPGVVATDFGNRAKHGGPDSRVLPNAQPVEEVAAIIADAIETPRAEVYTRPAYREQSAAYHSAEDVAEVEARFVPPTGR